MAEQESPGRATFRQEIVTSEERRWRRIIAGIETFIQAFPVGEHVTTTHTIEGARVNVFLLGDFRKLPIDPHVSTGLLVGIDEKDERAIYEYGYAPTTLNEEGDHVEDDIEGLRVLDLRTLTLKELMLIEELLGIDSHTTGQS